jgi:hypothetical protein
MNADIRGSERSKDHIAYLLDSISYQRGKRTSSVVNQLSRISTVIEAQNQICVHLRFLFFFASIRGYFFVLFTIFCGYSP